jgi:peptidyl-prolyl cis-trans isomerase C
MLSFDAVSTKIAEMLGARSWSLAAARYIAALAAGARIEGVMIEPTSELGAL